MNYLAHLFLAEPTDEGRVGSLLADFTNGTIDDLGRRFSPGIAKAIRHHREIDRFTDTHSAVIHCSRALSGAYGPYSGIVVDVVFDHFLLRYWDRFSSETTAVFFDSVYRALEPDLLGLVFPQRYRLVVGRMVQRRWLGMYHDLDNMSLALARIGDRFSRSTPLDGNIEAIRENYSVIETDFLSFFPRLVEFSGEALRLADG